jgi:UDP-N-acetylglucosamine 2-epimerase (non-hydrolysing)
VGNTAIDTLKLNLSNSNEKSTDRFKTFIAQSPYLLVTLHRREHSDRELDEILCAIRTLCLRHSDIRLIYPLHKNPHIQIKAREALSHINNIMLCDPIDATVFHSLLKNAHILLTDSGGIQEEATFLGKPTLVLRDTTERPEGIAAGVLKLVGCSCQKIVSEAEILLTQKEEYKKMSCGSNVYGDGHAADRIAGIIEKL